LNSEVLALARSRLLELGLSPGAEEAPKWLKLLAASDFAFALLMQFPGWRQPLVAGEALPTDPGLQGSEAIWMEQRARALEVIWREVIAEVDPIASCHDMSKLAARQIEQALSVAELEMESRFGCLRGRGKAVRLCAFGMGKLGGMELNFSSDLDLVFGHAEAESSDGVRSLEADAYSARLVRRCAQLLSEMTSFGQAWRVDLRLRPYGQAGQLALPFQAMEQYFQREGRDWERYAWIRALPVAGDREGGQGLIEQLRPFMYRRYLDYAAFEGLREMKQMIDSEVDRRGLEDNLKLGPGGIREVEFLVQLEQLIRGGRMPSLRCQSTVQAMQAIAEAEVWPAQKCQELSAAYRFLRRLENRVQMLDNQQTHDLPEDPWLKERLAQTLGFTDSHALLRELSVQRNAVQRWFQEAVLPTQRSGVDAAMVNDEHEARSVWRALTAQQGADAKPPEGLERVVWDRLKHFAESLESKNLSATARARLDRVVPQLWVLAKQTADAGATATRLIDFLNAVLRRSSYLALLSEQPTVAKMLVKLFAASPWAAERICASPLLLDEFMDPRLLAQAVRPDQLTLEWEIERAGIEADDLEATIERLKQFQQAQQLRLAMQKLFANADPISVTRGLSVIADFVIERSLALAAADLKRAHGEFAHEGLGFAVLGYGSLGGRELNFASDLDLVFVYDASLSEQESNGPRPLDGHRYFVRLAQRVLHLLTHSTVSGPLYAVDTRLRPDGAKGLLVSALDRFERYQRREAWTWEHQALVRARAVAGDVGLMHQFERIRADILALDRVPADTALAIQQMRERMRHELDRSDSDKFDLKQGRGGLVDIEFAIHRMVLTAGGHQFSTDTASLLQRCFEPAQAELLSRAHTRWLDLGLMATLNGARRVVALGADDGQLAEQVRVLVR
jgi:glutamate-ammonia-ligase adenylyltransferase